MADNRQKLVHLHTSDVKMPAQGLLDLGEIAVQHNDVEAALYIEKNNGEIAKFIDATAVAAKIEVEKLRAEGAEEALADKIEALEGSSHTHDNKSVLDGINSDKAAAWDKAIEDVEALANEVSDNERVVAAALNQINESAGFDENGKSLLPENISLTAAILDVTEKVNTLEGSNHTHENKDVLDGITAEKVAAWDAAEANAIADAEAKYQVKGEYEAAGAAAVVEAKLNTHKEDTVAHITEQERTDWNAAKTAIDTFLKDADMTEKAVDTLAELQTYMETDGAAATELVNRVSALESINHDAYIAADTQVLTDAKTYVDGKVDGKFDEAGAADAALAAAKADAEAKYQVKGEYEAAGAAEAALAAAKADAEAKYQVKGEYEAAGAADAALAAAKADAEAKYQVKGEYEAAGAADAALAAAKADAEAKYQVKGDYEAAGAAAQALVDAKAYSDGNLATAKAYVDGKVDGKFDEVGAAAQALTDAKTYTDEKLAVIKIDCGTY